MTKPLACLLYAAALVAASPYVETLLSEVGVDPAHQFVELPVARAPGIYFAGAQNKTHKTATEVVPW